MLTVHHLRKSVSDRVVWLVEELGIPYEIKCYDREADMAAPPEYKALYGFGTAPVITDGDLTLGESSAIVEYICRTNGDRLFRNLGDKDWVDFLFWFHFANGSLMPAITIEHFTGKVVGKHPSRTDRAADLIEARLAEVPFFAGDEFTAADVMMALTRFAGRHDLSDKPHTLDYLARITARPAWQRAAAFG